MNVTIGPVFGYVFTSILTLKINILLLLSCLIITTTGFSEDKFLRIKGVVLDKASKEELNKYTLELEEVDGKSSTIKVEKGGFDIWVRDNRKFRLHFIKEGFETIFAEINTLYMPSFAYSKKHKLALRVKLDKASPGVEPLDKPSITVNFVKNLNQFEVKDLSSNKFYRVPADYEPPFDSPADIYKYVKPTTKRLLLTTDYKQKKAVGESGMARALQGVLFADLNYCFFNEHLNDGNEILEKLRLFDPDTWNSINDIDSPEYGVIMSRTINREQSVDTIFALGCYVETTRLVLQSFTADHKVLNHLKQLNVVLEQFKAGGDDQEEGDFIALLNELSPTIKKLEETYKDLLKNKMNFEMSEDENFKTIKDKINQIHLTIIQ